MIVGGILTPIYAETRQTMDIDFLIQIELSESNKKTLIKEFEVHKFSPAQTWADTFLEWKKTQFIQIFEPVNFFKIDINLFTRKSDEDLISNIEILKKNEFINRKRVNILDIECWAQSKEDFILSKLLYKGYQDYKDALACYIRNEAELNMDYIKDQSINFNILKVWNCLKKKTPVEQIFPDD